MTTCQIYSKWNGNHLLIASIFKLHKYQTFGLLKMHNMNKIWFTNNKSVCKKVWFKINGLSKMLLFNFCFFYFSKFQMTIVKKLIEKPFLFNGFRAFSWSSTTSQVFLIYIFLTMKRRPFKIFLKFSWKCILFLYFF